MAECPYHSCDGSGYLPLIKNGKTIPNVRLFCDCHPQYGVAIHDHYTPRKHDDFDFPCSYSFRNYVERELTGHYLPDVEAQVEPEPVEVEQGKVIHQVIYEHRQTDYTVEAHKKLERIDKDIAAIRQRLISSREQTNANGRIDITDSYRSR